MTKSLFFIACLALLLGNVLGATVSPICNKPENLGWSLENCQYVCKLISCPPNQTLTTPATGYPDECTCRSVPSDTNISDNSALPLIVLGALGMLILGMAIGATIIFVWMSRKKQK